MTKKGLDNPVFIIKSGDTFYLTTEVLEYDPAKAKGNVTQEKGVEEVEKAFGAPDSRDATARQVPLTTTLTSAAQTRPH